MTVLLIAICLVIAWPIGRYVLAYWQFYNLRKAHERDVRDTEALEELRKKHKEYEARREYLNRNDSGITGCYFGPSAESKQYTLQVQALLAEIMRRMGATPLDPNCWPIQDPETGQWRMATPEEEEARRKK